MNYCTYFDRAYLPQGLALHESMEAHCQPYHLWILALCEETWLTLARLNLPHVTTVHMRAVETNELKQAREGRTWREYIWTLTGSWMVYVLRRAETVSYIDADCYFFSSPEQVFREIGDAPLGITPHRFPSRAQHFEVNGLYNVGLVYATRAGLPCIQEWAQQCINWCYYRAEDGKYADQKYLDSWPEKWGAHSIKHPGANLAPWNQEQYQYRTDCGNLLIDEQPLVWYHFHQGLDPKWPIDPFVTDFTYWRYEKALRRAGECLASLPH